MDLNKHIVDQRIRKIVEENPEWFTYEKDDEIKLSKAFVLLSVASYLGIELSEALSLMTEGGNDSGVDSIFVGDTVNFDFQVIIFQAKYKRTLENDSNYPANSVLRVIDAVKSIFDPSRNMQLNNELKLKVEEIRSLISDGFIPVVKAVLINNGLPWSEEGQKHIENAHFPPDQVAFEHYNHKNIIEHLKTKEKINETISIVGKGIVEEFNFKRVLIGKVNVAHIANLMDRYGDSLLERNIRKFLGLRLNRVNENIRKTLLEDKRNNFYFYNNGITMVCDNFRYNALGTENWQIKVEDIQIINGGQTCKTIQQTLNDNPSVDFSNVFVLLRLYEIAEDADDELLTDITIATNSQNPVDLRDLRANEKLQRDLEIAVQELGYAYRRKRDSVSVADAIPSSVAAEAVYTIWRKKPHLAKFRRSELFGKFYYEVFENLNAAQLVTAVLIFRYCDNQRKKEKLQIKYPHIAYSNYFLSMLMGQELLKELQVRITELTHRNFEEVKAYFENHKDELYDKANKQLIAALNKLYQEGYQTVELRRLSSSFRRGDLLQILGIQY